MNDQDQGKYDRDRAKAAGMTKREKLRLVLGREPTDEELEKDYQAGVPVLGGERDPIMKYFAYAHLPAHLQETSKQFGQLAEWIHAAIPRSAERTVALRKLLESKDCAVRAALP